jgi:hypothetical protein
MRAAPDNKVILRSLEQNLAPERYKKYEYLPSLKFESLDLTFITPYQIKLAQRLNSDQAIIDQSRIQT